jgi:hypothetical protein
LIKGDAESFSTEVHNDVKLEDGVADAAAPRTTLPEKVGALIRGKECVDR